MDRARSAANGGARGWIAPTRLQGLPPYPLADVPDIKARLRAEGRSVVDLGVGDPGLPVPELALEVLRAAVGDPALSKYGFQRGLPPGGDGFVRASLAIGEDGWADAGRRIREAL